MIGIGNDEQIVYIKVNDKKPLDNLIYVKGIKGFLGIFQRQEGFYYLDEYSEFTYLDKIPPHILINGKVALEKCNIIIEYSNGREKKIHFDTEKQRDLYIKRQFQGRNWRIFK